MAGRGGNFLLPSAPSFARFAGGGSVRARPPPATRHKGGGGGGKSCPRTSPSSSAGVAFPGGDLAPTSLSRGICPAGQTDRPAGLSRCLSGWPTGRWAARWPRRHVRSPGPNPSTSRPRSPRRPRSATTLPRNSLRHDKNDLFAGTFQQRCCCCSAVVALRCAVQITVSAGLRWGCSGHSINPSRCFPAPGHGLGHGGRLAGETRPALQAPK